MKIALFYPPMFLTPGRELRLSRSTSQVLTGSELSFVRQYELLSRRHTVHAYTPGPVDGDSKGFDLGSACLRGAYDVAISWNDPSPLTAFDRRTLRLVSYHLNNFDADIGRLDDHVDVWLSPSREHMRRMPSFANRDGGPAPDMRKWEVLPNGCDPSKYDALSESGIKKAPGTVIWASSPDRGLHHLMAAWPQIRRAVPWASLKIMYDLKWMRSSMNLPNDPKYPDFPVQRSRAIAAHDAIVALQKLPDRGGLTVMGPVTHDTVSAQMTEAEVLAYPCDPHRWTESYSVTLMEGCAAGACPVSTAVDALPEIYGAHIPLVPPIVDGDLGEFVRATVRALTDRGFREGVNARARALAETQTWERSTEALTRVIEARRPSSPHYPGATGFTTGRP